MASALTDRPCPDLEQVLLDPIAARRWLERYVNDGSPSGFTGAEDVDPPYSPLGATASFMLPLIQGSHLKRFSTVSNKETPPSWLDEAESVPMHPTAYKRITEAGASLKQVGEIEVVPTASARTVDIVAHPDVHLKLSFPGVIGRVDRSLPWAKAIAGPEISGLLHDACESDPSLVALDFLPEVSASSLGALEGIETACIVRQAVSSKNADGQKALLPFFSLFAHAGLSLANEVIDASGGPEGFVASVVEPLIDWYLYLAGTYGLVPEINAQNLLLSIDDSGRAIGTVFRDLMGVEKDLTIRSARGLSTEFEAGPYKSISADKADYAIRHSFSFDFKLGEYILRPALSLLSRPQSALSESLLHNRILEFADDRINKHLPAGYFPADEWYRHDRVLLTGRRDYIRDATRPAFRSR